MQLATVVLAAGQGTRMRSRTPKMLHRVLGRPLVLFPVLRAMECTDGPVVVVVGAEGDEVRTCLQAEVDSDRLRFAVQEQPLGTGDAVRSGLLALQDEPADRILILNGDVPCLTARTIRALFSRQERSGAGACFMAFNAPDPQGYGRVLHDDSGTIQAIREDKELEELDRDIDLVNAGVYAIRADLLRSFIRGVKRSEKHGEILLTDVVEYATEQGAGAEILLVTDPDEVQGVNTRVELASVTTRLRSERNRGLMLDGVTMTNPETVEVEYGVVVGRDSRIEAGVCLRGRTRIETEVLIGRGSVLVDTVVGAYTKIQPYCVLESTEIHQGCALGPFAHTRPGTVLEDGSKVGNFVETKKTVLGAGSKANHLTYLGDCQVGTGVNVGAGVITCNYDGKNKHRTLIGDKVFIGSDVQLVAPVTIGEEAVIAAGTTVTGDVPGGALAISRTDQKNVDGYKEKKKHT